MNNSSLRIIPIAKYLGVTILLLATLAMDANICSAKAKKIDEVEEFMLVARAISLELHRYSSSRQCRAIDTETIRQTAKSLFIARRAMEGILEYGEIYYSAARNHHVSVAKQLEYEEDYARRLEWVYFTDYALKSFSVAVNDTANIFTVAKSLSDYDFAEAAAKALSDGDAEELRTIATTINTIISYKAALQSATTAIWPVFSVFTNAEELPVPVTDSDLIRAVTSRIDSLKENDDFRRGMDATAGVIQSSWNLASEMERWIMLIDKGASAEAIADSETYLSIYSGQMVLSALIPYAEHQLAELRTQIDELQNQLQEREKLDLQGPHRARIQAREDADLIAVCKSELDSIIEDFWVAFGDSQPGDTFPGDVFAMPQFPPKLITVELNDTLQVVDNLGPRFSQHKTILAKETARLKGFQTALKCLAPINTSYPLTLESPTPEQVNLLVNGSFEQGTPPDSFTTIGVGSSNIDGWVITRNTVDYVGSYLSASHGKRSIDLVGTPGSGNLEQSFATVPGIAYELNFDMAGNPECGPKNKALTVTVAGQSKTFSHDSGLSWELRTWSFRTDAGITTIVFSPAEGSDRYCGPLLDNVRVTHN